MPQAGEILDQVAQAARLREGAAGVAAFLRHLIRESPLPLSELARRLGWPVPVAAAVRGELERAGLAARAPGGVTLSAAGQRLANEALGLAAQYDPLCPTCAGRRIVVDAGRWANLLDRLTAVHRANPAVDTTLDQSHGTPETALRRALAMHHAGALEGRDILILGDDDLVAVAIGLLGGAGGETGGGGDGVKARRLVVIEVDQRFLDHIAAAGRTYGFTVETVAHDLRRPLPRALRAAFDTVETDPPYTLPGLRLFLSRGLEGLRPGGGQDIFLSYAPRDPQGQRALLEACVELGLAPYAVTPDFNRYAGGGTLGNSSQFLHLRTTAETRPAVVGPSREPIYTLEERPAGRAYRCLECGAEHRVGPGERFPTIEALKGQGCPNCGGKRFRAGPRRRKDQETGAPRHLVLP